MNKYYEEIINTIGNTYNHFIDVSINKDLSIFNIELGEFAQIKLELINIQQNKDKVLEEINKQSEIILLDVKKVDKGYEIPLYINNKELKGFSEEDILSAGLAAYDVELGEDEYFVMGDNCNNSEDSRVSNIGNIKRSQFVGKIAGTLHKVTRQ